WTDMASDLLVLIVSWNVAALLRACLRSLYAAPGGALAPDGTLRLGRYSVRVCVVDNASADDSADMVRREFPQATLIATVANLGFTGGNNAGLRAFQADPPRYVLLLNPDTAAVDDALARMLDFMEAHPDVAALGPQLRYGDGRPQSSRRRFPNMMTALMESTLLEQWFPGNRWARAYRMADTPDDVTQDVDWVVGACLLVRWAAIAQVGLLDERFFMYSEELDWCRRMAAAGWRTVYLSEALVIHHEGQSSSQVVAARHVHFNTSKVVYFRKHHGAAQAGLLRGFLLLTFALSLAIEGLKFVLGHKRALHRERVGAYAQVLRSGLRPGGEGRA
ncbi:MAG: glycosyltransferase family 2 protein, partial [Chloroflexota bacterium]